MIYPTSLRETVTSRTVVGGKLHADKTSGSFITKAVWFLCRGEVIASITVQLAQCDLLKSDTRKINTGDRQLIRHDRCYNVITTNVIKAIK